MKIDITVNTIHPKKANGNDINVIDIIAITHINNIIDIASNKSFI